MGVPGFATLNHLESPFTNLNGLRAVEKFKINQLRPLGRGAGRVICTESFQKGLIMVWGIACGGGRSRGNIYTRCH